MKRLILVLALISITSAYAQQASPPPTFYRLVVFNEQNEMLIVKLKDTGFWVTPGVYQNGIRSMRQNIASLAEAYGIKVSRLQLRGVFGLVRRNGDQTAFSTRNVFSVNKSEGEVKMPEGVVEYKWLPVTEAIKQISFPHIKMFLQIILDNPKQVSAGTVSQYRQEGVWKADILEQFYPLTPKTQ